MAHVASTSSWTLGTYVPVARTLSCWLIIIVAVVFVASVKKGRTECSFKHVRFPSPKHCKFNRVQQESDKFCITPNYGLNINIPGHRNRDNQRKFGRNFRVTDSREEMRLDSEINHM